MSCKHCTFNNWVAPYESDKKPVIVCGEDRDERYILAYRNGRFALSDYWYDRGCFEIFYCPYCGTKLERPADSVFDKAEQEFEEAKRKKKKKQLDEQLQELEKERDSL